MEELKIDVSGRYQTVDQSIKKQENIHKKKPYLPEKNNSQLNKLKRIQVKSS